MEKTRIEGSEFQEGRAGSRARQGLSPRSPEHLRLRGSQIKLFWSLAYFKSPSVVAQVWLFLPEGGYAGLEH